MVGVQVFRSMSLGLSAEMTSRIAAPGFVSSTTVALSAEIGSCASVFKQDLQSLADELGIEIRIAHYPPYCSKYNPIEHRLFPHVTRACQGVIFTSTELVKELMENTHTATGLEAFVHVMDKVYETGRKVAADFKQNMRILFDTFLPAWNDRAVPAASQECTS
jgi:hypothetical protein